MTATELFFLPANPGQRFCIFHPAQGPVRGGVLYLPPFAEEMNKSRHMAALQARALAQAGYAVLQIDLLGCGDSSGDFGDADWRAWIDDALRAVDCLRQRVDAQAPLWLWGLRAGCLLAVSAATELAEPCHLLFWQPVVSGALQLQQFLRLRLAADMLSGQTKGAMTALREQIAHGKVPEIAGYRMSPAMAVQLEQTRLAPPEQRVPTSTSRLVWLDLGNQTRPGLGPAASKTLGEWADAGWRTQGQVIAGPAFWQSAEIEEAPGLRVATLAALNQEGAMV